MLDPAHVPPVASDERLARFIYQSKHIRNSDNTVKQDAFIPHPHTELSLTRHILATTEEIWTVGEQIAGNRTFYGRADVSVSAFNDEGLPVEAAPIPENPNHANAIKWPADKSAQKMKALAISLRSVLIRRT